MKKILFVFCLSAFFQTAAFAQQYADISGKVLDTANIPIQGASVYLLTPKAKAVLKTAVTDDKGEYQMHNVPDGKFLLEVSAIGYAKTFSEEFEAKGNPMDIPLIVLVPQQKNIEVVDVNRELPLVRNVHGKLVLHVENTALAAGNNALEVVKKAPGVGVDKDDNLTLMGQAGINVTIDGRQTYMTGEQLATLLKNTDGSQIKSVEVSTIRTAKDDAEGGVGTINITMKKNRLEGFNGSFVASGARGEKWRGNTSLNLNYQKEKTTFFGSYAYTNDHSLHDLGIARTIADETESTFFDQSSVLDMEDRTHQYKAGVELKTSARNTFLAQFTGNNNTDKNDNHSTTNMGRDAVAIDSILSSMTGTNEKFNRYSWNINNEFRIDTAGKKLTMDMDYSLFRTKNHTDYSYFTFLADFVTSKYDPEYERSNSYTDIDILSAKLDYTHPLGKGVLEAGLKYSNVSSDNDILFEYLDGDQDSWMNYTNRSNTFLYREQISAGYIDYAIALGKWDVKAGLRSEYTVSDGRSVTASKSIQQDYLDFFPSASLGYAVSKNHSLSLNYSRKVSRPNYKYLNPFEYYIDKRSYMKGNPDLKPQYTHGFTLNYTLFQLFNLTLGHDLTRNAMVESLGQDTELKTTWVIRENLGRTNTSYLNASIPFRIGQWWSMYNNLTGIHMYFEGPIAGHYVSLGSLFFQGSSMNSFKLKKSMSAELTMNYNSPFLYNVYRIHSRFNTDIGATYNFKDQRSSLKLAVTDVFRSNRNNVSTDFEEYNALIKQYRDSQTVRLTYAFKFGNLKQSFHRKEDKIEEKDRAM